MSYKVNVYCLGNSLLFCSDSVGQAMVNISIYLYELAEIHGPKAEEKRQKLNSLLPLFKLSANVHSYMKRSSSDQLHRMARVTFHLCVVVISLMFTTAPLFAQPGNN